MADDEAKGSGWWTDRTLRMVAILLLGMTTGGGTATALTTQGGLTPPQRLEIADMHEGMAKARDVELLRQDLRSLIVVTRRICRETISDDPTVCDQL